MSHTFLHHDITGQTWLTQLLASASFPMASAGSPRRLADIHGSVVLVGSRHQRSAQLVTQDDLTSCQLPVMMGLRCSPPQVQPALAAASVRTSELKVLVGSGWRNSGLYSCSHIPDVIFLFTFSE